LPAVDTFTQASMFSRLKSRSKAPFGPHAVAAAVSASARRMQEENKPWTSLAMLGSRTSNRSGLEWNPPALDTSMPGSSDACLRANARSCAFNFVWTGAGNVARKTWKVEQMSARGKRSSSSRAGSDWEGCGAKRKLVFSRCGEVTE
jgi:hypothetical protein